MTVRDDVANRFVQHAGIAVGKTKHPAVRGAMTSASYQAAIESVYSRAIRQARLWTWVAAGATVALIVALVTLSLSGVLGPSAEDFAGRKYADVLREAIKRFTLWGMMFGAVGTIAAGAGVASLLAGKRLMNRYRNAIEVGELNDGDDAVITNLARLRPRTQFDRWPADEDDGRW